MAQIFHCEKKEKKMMIMRVVKEEKLSLASWAATLQQINSHIVQNSYRDILAGIHIVLLWCTRNSRGNWGGRRGRPRSATPRTPQCTCMSVCWIGASRSKFHCSSMGFEHSDTDWKTVAAERELSKKKDVTKENEVITLLFSPWNFEDSLSATKSVTVLWLYVGKRRKKVLYTDLLLCIFKLFSSRSPKNYK